MRFLEKLEEKTKPPARRARFECVPLPVLSGVFDFEYLEIEGDILVHD